MKANGLMIVTLSSALLLGGCMREDDPNKRAQTGALIGAITGAVVGHQLDHKSGKWVGAAVGALAGAGVGHYMDNQQKDFEKSLAEERSAHKLEVERLKDDTLKLTVDSEVSFDFGKAVITPAFTPSLDKLAQVINKYDRTVVHVVGHTDNIGSDSYNQQLSERRALAVASYLGFQGVSNDRLRTEGRGEREPRATNDTEAGRQLNRRVEIFVKPVIQGQEQKAYESPRYY